MISLGQASSTKPLWSKLGLVEGSPLVLVNTTVHPVADYWDEAPFAVDHRHDFFAAMPFVHLFVDQRADLSRLIGQLVGVLDPAGTVWVSWPKKASRVATDITEDTIRDVVLPLGLVDVKVCSVTDLWSGLKLMVRKENRREWSLDGAPELV